MSESNVLVISGGSRGLGSALVAHFLERGDSVATFSRKSTPAVDAWTADKAIADRLLFQAVDASDAAALRAFVRATYDRFGRIDALVNNAGMVHDGVLALATEDQIDQMLDVNLRASLLLAKECARLMLLAGRGNIINIASVAAEQGLSGLATYAATKAGQLGMTRALARELGPKNIRVNAISPGFLETEMSAALSDRQREQIIRRTPLGRLGSPEDVVSVVEFLLSPGARFITGQAITVDGGASA